MDNLPESRSLPFVHAHSEWQVWPALLLFRLGSLHSRKQLHRNQIRTFNTTHPLRNISIGQTMYYRCMKNNNTSLHNVRTLAPTKKNG
jgi:hypothetical protein